MHWLDKYFEWLCCKIKVKKQFYQNQKILLSSYFDLVFQTSHSLSATCLPWKTWGPSKRLLVCNGWLSTSLSKSFQVYHIVQQNQVSLLACIIKGERSCEHWDFLGKEEKEVVVEEAILCVHKFPFHYLLHVGRQPFPSLPSQLNSGWWDVDWQCYMPLPGLSPKTTHWNHHAYSPCGQPNTRHPVRLWRHSMEGAWDSAWVEPQLPILNHIGLWGE